jgi:hypothetical protein
MIITWFEVSVPHLWENPFSIVHRGGAANSKKLLTTIISMFPFEISMEDKLNTCRYFKVIYHKYGKSLCNYLSFMKIFKSVEFQVSIDRYSRVIPQKEKNYDTRALKCDEGTISYILSHHIYDIIFMNCTKIKQITLLNVPKGIKKMKVDCFCSSADVYTID